MVEPILFASFGNMLFHSANTIAVVTFPPSLLLCRLVLEFVRHIYLLRRSILSSSSKNCVLSSTGLPAYTVRLRSVTCPIAHALIRRTRGHHPVSHCLQNDRSVCELASAKSRQLPSKNNFDVAKLQYPRRRHIWPARDYNATRYTTKNS